MKWEPVTIARFARDGGFTADQIALATAVALATSDGIATYELRAGSPGAGHWQGLWGIDTDRYPEFADVDLFVPQLAAQAAHALTDEHDGWGWSPVYTTGKHRFHMARAGTARTKENDAQAGGVPFTFHRTDRTIDRALERLTILRTQLAPIDRQRITQWQSTTR